MNILFADDNQETCVLFQLGLGLEGLTVHLAGNGAEALEAVKTTDTPFEAIVLDIEMPVMDGWGALEALRQLPEGHRIPIVIFTGYADPEIRARALEAGANEVVHKPFMPRDLAQILYSLI